MLPVWLAQQMAGVALTAGSRAPIHHVGQVNGMEMQFEGPHRPSQRQKGGAFPGVRPEIGPQRHEVGRSLPVLGNMRQKQLFSPE